MKEKIFLMGKFFDEGKIFVWWRKNAENKIDLSLKLIFYFDRNCSHLKPVNLLEHYWPFNICV